LLSWRLVTHRHCRGSILIATKKAMRHRVGHRRRAANRRDPRPLPRGAYASSTSRAGGISPDPKPPRDP